MAIAKKTTTIKKRKKKATLKSKKGVLAIEKRRAPRFNVVLPLDFSRVDNKEDYGGIVKNASKTGILVYLPEKLEVGNLLSIEIFFVKKFGLDTVKGIAKVVWADWAARESWGEHRYGLQFQSIEKKEFQKLRNLLKEVKEHPYLYTKV